MKTMKRIVAVFLAVMLIASIGIIGASAAGEKLTFDATGANAAGFTFDIYQVATLNTTTGKYTPATNDANVVSAINTASQSGAAFLAILEASSNPGTLVKDDLKEASYSTETAGIYYVKVVGTPDNVTKKKDSVIVWPQAASNGTYTMTNKTIDLSSKVSSGSDNITKAFSDGSTEKSVGQNDKVYFVLTADVVGSAEQKATEYVIWDKMSPGLTYNSDLKVYYDDSTTESTGDFTIAVADNNENDAYYGGGKYITITAKDTTLNNTSANGFYSHSTVRVEYSATLNNAAKVSPDYNPNKDGLNYNIGNGQVTKPGPEVKVYTYVVEIKKVIGDTTNPLPGAGFALYATEANATAGQNAIAAGESDANGIVAFKKAGDANEIRLAPGTYYVKETSAPANYALNNTVYPVTIADDKAQTSATIAPAVTVPNYPTKLPETGGMGTMMFTIIGGCLVLAAGVMFVIIMKKKSSSK